MKLTYDEKVVGWADPTQRATVTLSAWVFLLTLVAMFDTVEVRFDMWTKKFPWHIKFFETRFTSGGWIQGWNVTRRLERKVANMLFRFMFFAHEYKYQGKSALWSNLIWQKLPRNILRAWCMLRGHVWYGYDDGGPESGPGEVHTVCLRCDGQHDPMGTVFFQDDVEPSNEPIELAF